MAISQAMCTSFKVELMTGTHNFTNGADVFKLALFRNTAAIAGTFGAATTNYSQMGADEVVGTGYTAGGYTLTNVTPTSGGTTAFVDFNPNPSWDNATLTSSGALIYNSTDGGAAVAVLDFGADKISTAGTFTVILPADDSTNAIIRIA
jgi:hypothetical protein|tara:strand:+ start:1063 stop:1509 length:447 start_codon:yes stop_codon:yes gene_type:complete